MTGTGVPESGRWSHGAALPGQGGPVPAPWLPPGVLLVRSPGRLAHRLVARRLVPRELLRVVASAGECLEAVRRWPGSALLWEVRAEELVPACLECQELCRQFAFLRVAALLPQEVPPAWENAFRLAGACWVQRGSLWPEGAVQVALAHLEQVRPVPSWPWNVVGEVLHELRAEAGE